MWVIPINPYRSDFELQQDTGNIQPLIHKNGDRKMANTEETHEPYKRNQDGENKHHRDHPQNHPANQSGDDGYN